MWQMGKQAQSVPSSSGVSSLEAHGRMGGGLEQAILAPLPLFLIFLCF